jgi:hypothetical protein
LSGLYLFLISVAYFNCQAWAAFQEIKIEDNKSLETLPIAGNILEARKWKDKSGIHLIIITEKIKGTFCEPEYTAELHAYGFDEANARMVKAWEIVDFSENACSSVRYLPGTLKLSDIDGNGTIETAFFYEHSHDCCDPIRVKYILHKDGVQLPIHGQVPMIKEETESYKKEMGKAYEKCPLIIKDFASKAWDGFIADHYGAPQ